MPRTLKIDEIQKRIDIIEAKNKNPDLTWSQLTQKFNTSTRVIKSALDNGMDHWKQKLSDLKDGSSKPETKTSNHRKPSRQTTIMATTVKDPPLNQGSFQKKKVIPASSLSYPMGPSISNTIPSITKILTPSVLYDALVKAKLGFGKAFKTWIERHKKRSGSIDASSLTLIIEIMRELWNSGYR